MDLKVFTEIQGELDKKVLYSCTVINYITDFLLSTSSSRFRTLAAWCLLFISENILYPC